MNREAISLSAFIRIDKPCVDDIYDPVRFAALVRQTREDANKRAMVQVRELLAAGWKYEVPGEGHYDYDPWQWYWRAPPKRTNSRGQKFLSTNQAWNALQRRKSAQ